MDIGLQLFVYYRRLAHRYWPGWVGCYIWYSDRARRSDHTTMYGTKCQGPARLRNDL